jgi:hypothetical protein
MTDEADQIHALIPIRNAREMRITRTGMTEKQKRMALARKEFTERVASFRATQQKFQRAREEYYATTMEAARSVQWNKFAGGPRPLPAGGQI